MDYMEVAFLVGGLVFLLVLVAAYAYWRGMGHPVRAAVVSVFRVPVLLLAAIFGILAWGATPILTISIPDYSFIQGSDGEVRAVFGKKARWYQWGVWEWDDRLDDGARIVSYAAEQEVYAMHASPITENPRALPVRVTVYVERFGTVSGYLAYHKALGNTTLAAWIESQMLDFYASHSRDIAHWNNHYKRDQQEECRTMIQGFLEPRLERIGGRFKDAKFHVMTGI